MLKRKLRPQNHPPQTDYLDLAQQPLDQTCLGFLFEETISLYARVTPIQFNNPECPTMKQFRANLNAINDLLYHSISNLDLLHSTHTDKQTLHSQSANPNTFKTNIQSASISNTQPSPKHESDLSQHNIVISQILQTKFYEFVFLLIETNNKIDNPIKTICSHILANIFVSSHLPFQNIFLSSHNMLRLVQILESNPHAAVADNICFSIANLLNSLTETFQPTQNTDIVHRILASFDQPKDYSHFSQCNEGFRFLISTLYTPNSHSGLFDNRVGLAKLILVSLLESGLQEKGVLGGQFLRVFVDLLQRMRQDSVQILLEFKHFLSFFGMVLKEIRALR